MFDDDAPVQMHQDGTPPDPPKKHRGWGRKKEQEPKPKPEPAAAGKITAAQAKAIADRYKAQRGGPPGRRPWAGSPFDPWKHEITELVKQGLRNDEVLRYLRTQDRRITASSTKLRAWLKREGIRVKGRKNQNGQTAEGAA